MNGSGTYSTHVHTVTEIYAKNSYIEVQEQ